MDCAARGLTFVPSVLRFGQHEVNCTNKTGMFNTFMCSLTRALFGIVTLDSGGRSRDFFSIKPNAVDVAQLAEGFTLEFT